MKTIVQKVALVTGGSRGLGRDMAVKIAQKGIDVIITYNSKKNEAQTVVSEIQQLGRKAAALQFSAGNIEGFETFASILKATLKDLFGADRFDFLVNNAGFGMVISSFAETKVEQFDQLMNVHFRGVFFLTQQLLPLLNEGGGIVNISTGLTRFTNPGSGTYASMKSAVETLTKYLALELGPRNIRANVVAPGAIATDFNGGLLRDTPQIQEHIKSITALPRIGHADDIGGVVAFLCSDDAKWVTAQRIEASGGMHL